MTTATDDAPNLFVYTSLLDETTLHLAVLDQNAAIGPMHAWRARCVALVSSFDDQLLTRTVTPAHCHRLRLSHALLLDEATLAVCPETMRKAWEVESLCRVELNEPNAGQVVLADIDALHKNDSDAAGWLHWYVRLFAAGLLRGCPNAAQRRRQLTERLRSIWPQATKDVNGSK